ncbi:MAG: hypothetical protein NWF08_04020 [Candidatus Bathyarchaeota archaeon]|nr:hypothetical protein [Candidatus Bathyarchaeota archaeon]
MTKEDVKYDMITSLARSQFTTSLVLGKSMMIVGAVLIAPLFIIMAGIIQLRVQPFAYIQAMLAELIWLIVIITTVGIVIILVGYLVTWRARKKFKNIILKIAKERKIKL